MDRTFTAFISLGFACGGPEMGDYGEFNVDLSEDEIKKIDNLVKEETNGKRYKRYVLKERFPELHEKIVAAAQGLVRDVLVHDARTFMEDPIPEEVDEKLEKLSYHEQADYLASHYDLEPEDLDGAEVCYYLSNDELPRDYQWRHK